MQMGLERSLSWKKGWQFIAQFLVGLGIVALITTVAYVPVTAQSSEITQARVSEILDGDQVFIQEVVARLNDVANRGNRVRTGSSRAQLDFNTGAVARLSPNSVLTVGQCAQLQSGILLVSGAVSGCGNSVTAGVRGTTYVMEVDDQGQERIQVLEGEVVVSPTVDGVPSADGIVNESDNQVVLTSGQKIVTEPDGNLGQPEGLSADDFIRILTGFLFDGFSQEIPGMPQIREAFTDLFPGVPFPLDGGDGLVPDLPSSPF